MFYRAPQHDRTSKQALHAEPLSAICFAHSLSLSRICSLQSSSELTILCTVLDYTLNAISHLVCPEEICSQDSRHVTDSRAHSLVAWRVLNTRMHMTHNQTNKSKQLLHDACKFLGAQWSAESCFLTHPIANSIAIPTA